MAGRAVKVHGKAGGAGAVGSEEQQTQETDPPTPPVVRGTGPATAAEQQIMEGGPEDGNIPGFQPIKYGNLTFNTPEELTAHLDRLNSDIRTRDEKIRTSQTPAPPPPAPPAPAVALATGADDNDPWKGIDEELFVDPKKALKRVAEFTRQTVTNELTARYQAERNMEAFWNTFYTENKEFSSKRDFVGMVLQKHQGTLGPLGMDEAKTKLGELVRDEYLTLTGGAVQPHRGGRAVVEAPSGERQKAPVAQQDTKVQSLTAALKERAARRNAERKSA